MNSHSAFFKLLGLIIAVLLIAWIADQNDKIGSVMVALVLAAAAVWFTFNYQEFEKLATKFGYSTASNVGAARVVQTGHI